MDKIHCPLVECKDHKQIAQLILWREGQSNNPDRRNHNYHVALSGSSGPSTLGLSMLFIDEEHKFATHSDDLSTQRPATTGNMFFLFDLQEKIQEQFVEIYLWHLERIIKKELALESKPSDSNNEQQQSRYVNLVLFAVSEYLNKVLYRHFLPFLSENDIHRLVNGLYTFIYSMKYEKASPFAINYPANGDQDYISSMSNATVETTIQLIPRILEKVLRSFRGVEALYDVLVEHRSPEYSKEKVPSGDLRESKSISLRQINSSDRKKQIPAIYYFMAPIDE